MEKGSDTWMDGKDDFLAGEKQRQTEVRFAAERKRADDAEAELEKLRAMFAKTNLGVPAPAPAPAQPGMIARVRNAVYGSGK